MKPELLTRIEAMTSINEEALYDLYLNRELDVSDGGNFDDTFEMGIEVGYTRAVKEILQMIKEETN